MKIKDIGGEFKLIERVTRAVKDENVIYGIGDDTAVVKMPEGQYLMTTDMLCEGDHFSFDYFTPRQVGIKAMVSNLSDIAAMGGTPLYALISLALTDDLSVETVDGIYEGLYESGDKYGAAIIGGDMTHSSRVVINIVLIGRVQPEALVTRAGAHPGDEIYVSGTLGGATAGLKLFLQQLQGFDDVKMKHTEPAPRFDIAQEVSRYATAMEDVSDGLASEVRNICNASGTGAIIYADSVPIDASTLRAGERLDAPALDFALFGGEDFELVYTLPPDLSITLPGVKVGKIRKENGVYLQRDGTMELLTTFGFDHFK